jgi:amino acid transporter
VEVAEARQERVHADTGEFETPLARAIGPGMLLVFVVCDVLGAGIYALVGVVAAAVYVHSAFKVPFFTFVIAFAVMCSGIASAATLSRAFAGDYLSEFVDLPVVLVAVAFLLVVALINFRGISESVKLNMA